MLLRLHEMHGTISQKSFCSNSINHHSNQDIFIHNCETQITRDLSETVERRKLMCDCGISFLLHKK